MEMSHTLLLTRLILLLLILVTVTTCDGHIHGSRVNQAETLMAFRRARSQVQLINTGNENLIKSGFNELKTDNNGRSMEYDYIHGGLPGQPLSKASMFKQYAGYINVDRMNGRSLFYYFVEAIHEPSSKPLVLWLNGGTFCNSFSFFRVLFGW